MHLLTFMCLKQPGFGFRLAVLGAQGIFFNAFLAAYVITPRTCHRFVGYLEEEAVKTYTHALADVDAKGSDASAWASEPAPDIAIQYWRLPPDASGARRRRRGAGGRGEPLSRQPHAREHGEGPGESVSDGARDLAEELRGSARGILAVPRSEVESEGSRGEGRETRRGSERANQQTS